MIDIKSSCNLNLYSTENNIKYIYVNFILNSICRPEVKLICVLNDNVLILISVAGCQLTVVSYGHSWDQPY